jgi:AAA+ superfamily predicted ATPase
MTGFGQQLREHLHAGYPCLMIPSREEARIETILKEVVADGMKWDVVFWDEVEGFDHGPDDCKNFGAALMALKKNQDFEKKAVIVFRDAHTHLNRPDSTNRRMLRNILENNVLNTNSSTKAIILIQPTTILHQDIAHCVTVLDFPLPSMDDMKVIMEPLKEKVSGSKKLSANDPRRTCAPDLDYKIRQSLRGLTSGEATNCLYLCLHRHQGFVPEIIDTIEEAKSASLRKTEIVTYTPKEQIEKLDSLAGYEELTSFVRQKSLAYSPDAAEVGLDLPKGVIIAGIPGTGKSKALEAISRELQLPLLNFDFSAIFNSLVGESERRMREIIKVVEAQEGCVLGVDEADKSLGHAVDSTGDSGVTRRIFGLFLSWLARKNDRTFVVMTLNRTKGLPPELQRKGRFDEIFWTDMPTDEERKTIFEIHMVKRNLKPSLFNAAQWEELVRKSKDCIGSEIEEAVKTARFMSYQHNPANRAVPTFEMMLAALAPIAESSLYRVEGESIKEIRDFGKKGRPVSRAKATTLGKSQRFLDLGDDGDNREKEIVKTSKN